MKWLWASAREGKRAALPTFRNDAVPKRELRIQLRCQLNVRACIIKLLSDIQNPEEGTGSGKGGPCTRQTKGSPRTAAVWQAEAAGSRGAGAQKEGRMGGEVQDGGPRRLVGARGVCGERLVLEAVAVCSETTQT